MIVGIVVAVIVAIIIAIILLVFLVIKPKNRERQSEEQLDYQPRSTASLSKIFYFDQADDQPPVEMKTEEVADVFNLIDEHEVSDSNAE